MRALTVRVSDAQYQLIKQRAFKQCNSMSEEIRNIIQNGLLFDTPTRNTQIQTTCAVEGLLLLRKLADLRGHQLSTDAQKEAQKLVKKLLWKDE